MIEVRQHAAEDASRLESQRSQQRVERGDPGEAGAARSGLETLAPEGFGQPRFAGGIRLPAVPDDFRRGLEWDALVEAQKEPLEVSDSRVRARDLEIIEDVVDGNGQRFDVSFSTSAPIFARASGPNQKSRNGSSRAAASNRASAPARERRLISA